MNNYNIEFYNDGLLSKYGNEYNIDAEDLIDLLSEYDIFNEYTEDEISKSISNIATYHMYGNGMFQIKVTKLNQ
tara:strand:- start:1008 stop:1229 length:222 start_codon:yes stop_codon:yes gene_type:complete